MTIESVYQLNEVELKNARKWLKKHKKICKNIGGVSLRRPLISGGYLSYIFSTNSVCIASAIRCSCNNEEFDITDYTSW